MDYSQQPVKIYCPISDREEIVYFSPREIEGKMMVSFDGCDNNWHSCDECEKCKLKAHKIYMNKK